MSSILTNNSAMVALQWTAATGWLMLIASLLMGSWYIWQMYRRMFAHGRA